MSSNASLRSVAALRKDIPASLVVFLVAVPLSLGIALASGAPVASGLLAAIVGGIVVGSLSGAPLQVSGPAAGLTVLVFDFTSRHGFAATCAATMLAGALQMVLSRFGVARVAMAISPAVVHGMLAGIGIVIVLAQVHVVLGGSPQSSALVNLAELPRQIADLHGVATMLGIGTLALLVLWGLAPRVVRAIPAPLVAIAATTAVSVALGLTVPRVEMPSSIVDALALPALPAGGALLDLAVFVVGMTIVASTESLLCAVATDKLHDGPRVQLDRELFAQGAGNFVCGLIGGLPVTGVVVRSSANIDAGARTRLSAILHGVWVLVFVGAFGGLIAYVPLAALAALLVLVGLRLVNRDHIRDLARHGELPTYAVTLAGVVFLNLLAGIAIGVALAIARLLYRMGRMDVRIDCTGRERHVLVTGALTFMGVPRLLDRLAEIPPGCEVEVEVEVDEIDHAGIEALETWRASYARNGGTALVELNDARHEHVFISRVERDGRSTVGPVRLLSGTMRFERRSRRRYGALLDSFANGQRPHTLFITCCDSRIVPSLLTSSDPGDLFLVRNIGNLVPDPRFRDRTPAEAAAIEYAVAVLGVSSIVVCGHSSCGAMRAVCQGVPAGLEAMPRWLESGLSAAECARLAGESVDEAARQNVLLQLEHLAAHPVVAERLARGELELFGWFYAVETGAVSVFDPSEGRFVPLRPRLAS